MGKVALVTGGNSGIGFEVVRALALRGMTVWLGSRDRGKGEAAVADLADTGDVHLAVLDTVLPNERILRAGGVEPPSRIDRAIGHLGLKHMARRDPIPDNAPDQFEALIKTVYPDGCELDDLGPQEHAEPS